MVTVLDSSYTYGNRLAREQGMTAVVKNGPESVLNMFRAAASGAIPDEVVSLTNNMAKKDGDSFLAGYCMGLKELCVVLNLETDDISAEPVTDVAAPIEAEVVEEFEAEPVEPVEPESEPEAPVAEPVAIALEDQPIDEAVAPYWTWAQVVRHLIAREGSALAVARLIGVTHPAVMNWTRGSNPQKKQREKIAAAVGRSVDFFTALNPSDISGFEARIETLKSLIRSAVDYIGSQDNSSLAQWAESAAEELARDGIPS